MPIPHWCLLAVKNHQKPTKKKQAEQKAYLFFFTEDEANKTKIIQ